MVPHGLSVIFLLGFGIGLLGVAHRGYQVGELPAGSSFWRPFRPNREDNPLAFHFYLLLYVVAGLALCVWGLLGLMGMAPDLKWQ